MPKYRKQPIEIEAEQYFKDRELTPFLKIAICDSDPHRCKATHLPLHIHTKEGPLLVKDTNWVIKGVIGEFYPCQAEVFALTYERTPDHAAV